MQSGRIPLLNFLRQENQLILPDHLHGVAEAPVLRRLQPTSFVYQLDPALCQPVVSIGLHEAPVRPEAKLTKNKAPGITDHLLVLNMTSVQQIPQAFLLIFQLGGGRQGRGIQINSHRKQASGMALEPTLLTVVTCRPADQYFP